MSDILKEFINYVKDNPLDDEMIDKFYKLIDSFNGQCIALAYDNSESGNGRSYLKRCSHRCKNGLFCEYHNTPNKAECVICKKPGRCTNVIHDHKYECYGTIFKPNLQGLNNHFYIDRPINIEFKKKNNSIEIKKTKNVKKIKISKIKKNMDDYDKFSLSDPDGACSYIIYCKLNELSKNEKTLIYNVNGNKLGFVDYWKNINVPEQYKKNNIIYDEIDEPIYRFKILNNIYRKSDKEEFVNYIYNKRLIKTYDVELVKKTYA